MTARAGKPCGSRFGRLPAALFLGGLLLGQGLIACADTRDSTPGLCLADLARLENDIYLYLGGDDVRYGFGRRAREAARLCESGANKDARNLMAEIRADFRSLQHEINAL